jgi:hypothetical protein
MRIIEFRLILPTTVAQYGIANRFMIAKYTKEATKDGEGIEIVRNEVYEETGQSTYKIYHVKSKLPSVVRWALPDKYCHAHETSLNSYPHFRTQYEIPGMGDNFYFLIESNHTSYSTATGLPDNLLNLNEQELKERKVVYLDILNGDLKPSTENDIHNFVCPEIGIFSPLTAPNNEKDSKKPPEWTKYFEGEMMVCVKVIKFRFKWKGVQTVVENVAMSSAIPNTFVETNRLLLSWSKEWCKMTWEDIQLLENEIQEQQKGMVYEE